MVLPSGDHIGRESKAGWSVSGVANPPSAATLKISPL